MFKVTKDAEIDLDKDFIYNIDSKIEKGVKNRRKAKSYKFSL